MNQSTCHSMHLDNEVQAWRATSAAKRTYLWLAHQELEPLTHSASDSEADADAELAYSPLFDAWPYANSAPASPTTTLHPLSIDITTLKMPHSFSHSLCDGRKIAAAPKAVLVKKTSRLRHAVSCVSLPRSPRQTHTSTETSKAALLNLSNASTPSLGHHSPKGVMAALHMMSRKPRARSSSPERLYVLPPLKFSETPAIIVTPSSAEAQGRTAFSPISPSFPPEYLSESESSYYDFAEEGFGSSTDSDSTWSKRSRDSSPERNNLPASCARAIQGFKGTYPEEKNTPKLYAPKSAYQYVSNFFTAREMLTIDSSEFLNGRTIMEPGKHGCVSPCVSALADHLSLFAKYNPGGCHIFLSRQTLNRRDFEYQYQGFYRIVQKDMRPFQERKDRATRMDVKSNVSEDDHLVFFLQFLGYDREVYNAMDRFAKSEAGLQKKPLNVQSRSRVLRRPPTSRWQRQVDDKEKPLVTTVDGIDFEIMPTPVVWNHGYLKDDSWICV